MVTFLEKRKTKLSQQTYEELKIIEAVQFLLLHQVRYVLAERFCQDSLENYFGGQDSLRAWKDLR